MENWKERKKTGRPKALKSPEELWSYACDYFETVDNNPWFKQDFVRGGEYAGAHVNLTTMRPYTWEGFEDYLFKKGIIQDLDDYRCNLDGRYAEFKGTVRAIGKIIFDRNLTGAAANFFNANIIARQLGMADRSDLTVRSEQPLFGDEQSKE